MPARRRRDELNYCRHRLSTMPTRNALLLVVLCGAWAPRLIGGAFSTPFFNGRSGKACSRSFGSSVVTLLAEETRSSTQEDNSSTSAEEEAEEESHISTAAELEAEELRRRAKELMAEARAMELELGDTRTDTTKRKHQESDALIEQLFSGNATSVHVSERLADERWSPDQLVLVVERLHERQVQAFGRTAGTTRSPNGFQIGAASNKAEPDEEEWNRLDAQIESVLEAASMLDDQTTANVNQNHRWTGRVASSLRSRLKELRRTDEQEFQRKLAASVNAAANSNQNVSVQEYMSGTLGTPVVVEGEDKNGKSFNISLIMDSLAMVPMWIPSSLLPFLIITRPRIESEDIKTIRDVLTGTSFYCTSSDSIPGAAIFRGNIRTPLGVVNTTMERNQSAVVFEDIQNRLSSAGLSDRVQLFFWNDPEWRPGKDAREPEPKPVVLALPTEVVPEQSSEGGYASLALKVRV